MKLRLRGNSIRMRITRSELKELCDGNALVETTTFAENHVLRYELCVSHSPDHAFPVHVSYRDYTVQVTLSPDALSTWKSDQVGVYANVPNGAPDGLAVSLEKDFACLDRSHEENADAFVNPKAGAAC